MVNGPHNFPYFIKNGKRDRQKQDYWEIPRMFPKLKDKFPSVSEFNTFLCSDEDKMRFLHLLENDLLRLTSSISKELINSCGKFVRNVSNNKKILDFKYNQFEADTVMFPIYYNIS